jgi:hypothetical protein
MFIKLTQQIKNVTDSAQRTADSIEHTVGRFGKVSSLSYFAQKAAGMAKTFKRKK